MDDVTLTVTLPRPPELYRWKFGVDKVCPEFGIIITDERGWTMATHLTRTQEAEEIVRSHNALVDAYQKLYPITADEDRARRRGWVSTPQPGR